ncbi:phage protein Gp36 family protein [Chryseobacterium koreense]
MFLEIADLGTTIYNYQIEQITEGDENILLQAMASAEEELRSYLSAIEWSDGRPKLDVDAILGAEGNARNALLVRMTATIAKFYVIELCNANIIYETAKERYDRAVTWLRQLARGEIKLSTLPETPDIDPDSIGTEPFIYGSREKFNHE